MTDDDAERDAGRDAMALVRARLEDDDEAAGVILDGADLPALALALTDMAADFLTRVHGDRAAEVAAVAQSGAIAAMEAEADS